MLRRRQATEVGCARRQPVDETTLAAAREIVEAVRTGGETALRACAQRFGERSEGEALVIERVDLERACDRLPSAERELLERTARRIASFAQAQRAAVADTTIAVPGGAAGQRVAAVERAGCYAPGGRFPLPSTVLMTAVTARTAGVEAVWVASPRPSEATLAAAAVAGADAVLAAGGARAIAALAFGAGVVPACDVVVGPGNRWVTAAKQLVASRVGIDALAGPSELVVLADASADPGFVAADLLAQAEHDPDALPILVTTDAALADAVERELRRQLDALRDPDVGVAALDNGFAVVTATLDEAIDVCDRIAPEHLEVMLADPGPAVSRLRHFGTLFVGAASAEVFGDYGVGPNHTLPTGGVARFRGGLSVLDFLRISTWVELTPGEGMDAMARDAAAFARVEGLEAHARAAERRLGRR